MLDNTNTSSCALIRICTQRANVVINSQQYLISYGSGIDSGRSLKNIVLAHLAFYIAHIPLTYLTGALFLMYVSKKINGQHLLQSIGDWLCSKSDRTVTFFTQSRTNADCCKWLVKYRRRVRADYRKLSNKWILAQFVRGSENGVFGVRYRTRKCYLCMQTPIQQTNQSLSSNLSLQQFAVITKSYSSASRAWSSK